MKTKHLVDGYDLDGLKTSWLKDIGSGMSTYRKTKLLTQEELGEMLNLDKSQVCKLERGGNPTIGTLVNVCKAMGASISYEIIPDVSISLDVLNDLVLCLFEFAGRHDLSVRQAFAYLNRFGGIDYYLSNADTMLSLPLDDTLDDLTILCRRKGGGL